MAAPSGTPTPAVITAVRYWDVDADLLATSRGRSSSSRPSPAGAHPARPLSGRAVRAPVEGDRAHSTRTRPPHFPRARSRNSDGIPAARLSWWSTSWGCSGPSGMLPLYYSELIRERLRAKDTTMAAFFNIFNHRMISLFYQAWEKYRFTIAYERGRARPVLASPAGPDRAGDASGLQNRQTVPDDSLLFYSGLFALHARSATALRADSGRLFRRSGRGRAVRRRMVSARSAARSAVSIRL